MTNTIQPYLVTLEHPSYPQRKFVINALSQDNAQIIANEQVHGTYWTVASVVLRTDLGQ